MYIEFKLSDQTTAQGAAYASNILTQALHKWSDRFDIPYDTKTHKRIKRITFDDDAHYSLFAMTWDPDKKIYVWAKWRIVSDLNNKTTFDSVL